ncbi:Alkaline phosphatase synthesis transcriptional regulatory protein PhoP [Methylacidimicrobium cyclopophantes]|uniref:Phosphate regulon transcriptional regulatory protein PhoB n=1 Tax=Methylacidimicrobium cyclopophantes TaxID=1041766 RepID=A0A5E6MFZ0_9BACT|nr:response regulator transcription factor [Methylacidimicrobium cyclopophantes]VVM04969.1 Alkaline phosphatase synthesis transcriptional regulatory protein PhoP [Methylacidimicrobium cyclopophantes]
MTASAREHVVLVVEDEPDVLELICLNLAAAGFRAVRALNGTDGLEKAMSDLPDLVVLDLMLPELDGLEVCKTLRRNPTTADLPILILTAKAEPADRVQGLELGADDYLTKPFSPRELVLRTRSLLRRRVERTASVEPIRHENLVVHPRRHEAFVRNRRVDLTATEFRLLNMLLRGRGRVHRREELLREVWGYEKAMDTRTVDTHVRRLREKLGRAARYIETVRGIGYRFRPTRAEPRHPAWGSPPRAEPDE